MLFGVDMKNIEDARELPLSLLKVDSINKIQFHPADRMNDEHAFLFGTNREQKDIIEKMNKERLMKKEYLKIHKIESEYQRRENELKQKYDDEREIELRERDEREDKLKQANKNLQRENQKLKAAYSEAMSRQENGIKYKNYEIYEMRKLRTQLEDQLKETKNAKVDYEKLCDKYKEIGNSYKEVRLALMLDLTTDILSQFSHVYTSSRSQ